MVPQSRVSPPPPPPKKNTYKKTHLTLCVDMNFLVGRDPTINSRWVPMKTSNESCVGVNPRLYRSQTLSPFLHSPQWRNYRHIRHGTKPEQQSTIQCDKEVFVREKSLERELAAESFMVPDWPEASLHSRSQPRKLRFQMIMVESKETQIRVPTIGYGLISLG